VADSTAFIDLRGSELPADLAVIRYEAREAISRPFEVEVEFSTEDFGFQTDPVLRTRVLLTLVDDQGRQRLFDGIVERIAFAYLTGTRFHFRLGIRPTLAALAHREGCRIFQEMSVVDAIKSVLADAGVDNAQFQLVNDYEPREIIVQYRESELDFIHRLLEDEGIFYFFRHTPDGHTIVFADDPGAFAPADDAPEVFFAMGQGMGAEPLPEFSRTRALRTTSVRLRDYDFEKPQTKPESTLPAKDLWPQPLYDYPGGFTAGSAASRRAKARISAERRDADTVHGLSRAIGLRCGVPFSVEGAAQDCCNGRFVVTELRTWGEQTRDGAQRGNEVCHNEFSGIPEGAPFALRRSAKRPCIRGIQTATVTGPSNDAEAIHVDKYGRVKVRFHWDRAGKQDDTSSSWLRVAQVPTGGSMILPRVGWEVAVAFLEGDPDRPFVLGRVYNAGKTPPYALPGTQSSGSIKSHSSPGGAGYNELLLADSGGSQGWSLHAAKDLNISVGHDKEESVGVDEKHHVHVNMSVAIGANESLDVGANQSMDVGAVLSNKIGGNQSIEVGGNETDNATSNYIEHVGGDRSYTVGGNQIVISNTVMGTIAGDVSRSVGTAQVGASVASIADNIGGNYTETVGAVKVELLKGTSAETVGGNKDLTSIAAELHLVKGTVDNNAGASVTQMVGGLHYEKVAGDYSVKAPLIAVIGAIGDLKGGGSNLKLGGGPVVLKGSKIAIKTALLVKFGGSLKLGPG